MDHASSPGIKSAQPNSAQRRSAETAVLRAIAFGSGAAVMTIEILGTRVIGPVFGVSLFVWSGLLSVTLASLAAGYYFGGVLVDRTPKPQLLGSVVLAAGVLLSLAPLLRRPVLGAA